MLISFIKYGFIVIIILNTIIDFILLILVYKKNFKI